MKNVCEKMGYNFSELTQMKINKKIVAKEWLILLGAFLIGIFVMPLLDPLTHLILDDYDATYPYTDVLRFLWQDLTFVGIKYGGNFSSYIFSYVITLTPYLMFQIGRATIWALRTMKD